MARRVWIIGGLVVLAAAAVTGWAVWHSVGAERQAAPRLGRHLPPRVRRPVTPRPTPRSRPAPPAGALGTVAWAGALRAALADQWGMAAPPLWIVPDPGRPHAWLALAPQAHAGALWWAVATPADPTPRFHAVPTSLNVTTAQVDALPPVLAAALQQAYDLMHDEPWRLTVQTPPLASLAVMSPTQAEADGTVAAPVGWQAIWNPPLPQSSGFAGAPAETVVSVVMPWTATSVSAAPDLVSESALGTAAGTLRSGATVDVLMNGQTQQPLPVTDAAAYTPASVAQGLMGPGRAGS